MALPAAPQRVRPTAPDPAGPPLPPLSAPPVPILTRRRVAFVLGALIVLWIVLVFARAVASQATASGRADALRTQNAARAASLAAGQHELQIVQSPAFVRLQARAYGLGEAGERIFTLQPGSPAPRAITPLGSPASGAAPATPLDAWLALFFGP
jgi:hypothetical protein